MSSMREDGSRLEISLCLPLQPDVFVYYTISSVRAGQREGWEEGGRVEVGMGGVQVGGRRMGGGREGGGRDRRRQ